MNMGCKKQIYSRQILFYFYLGCAEQQPNTLYTESRTQEDFCLSQCLNFGFSSLCTDDATWKEEKENKVRKVFKTKRNNISKAATGEKTRGYIRKEKTSQWKFDFFSFYVDLKRLK